MRSVRLTVAALLAAAALSACSGDSITAPDRRIAEPSIIKATDTCRLGFIGASGRCTTESTTLTGGTGDVTTTDTCRLGFIGSSGRCE